MKKPRNQWWHRISWAFLRLVGADGRLNTEKKLRLQLFKANSLKISTEYSENQTTEVSFFTLLFFFFFCFFLSSILLLLFSLLLFLSSFFSLSLLTVTLFIQFLSPPSNVCSCSLGGQVVKGMQFQDHFLSV